MEITARDIARLIELEKKKAELSFKKAVFGIDTEKEIIEISANAMEISNRMRSAGIEIAVPCDDALKAYDLRINAFTNEQIKDSMKARSGDPYSLLKEKGEIVKRNFSNRMEIAKLAIILAKMKKDHKSALTCAIRSGKIGSEMFLDGNESGLLDQFAKSLRRCGIFCEIDGSKLKGVESANDGCEVKVELPNRIVYLPSSDAKSKLDENMKKMVELNRSIQLKNAVRQIKTFSEEEDKEFVDLQRKYLDLLNEQDEILRDFNKEEALSVTVG